MDYFGVTNFDIDDVDLFAKPCFENFGFECAEFGCKNKQFSYGKETLPYCNQMHMEKNVQYLLIENSKLKGEVSAYSSLAFSSTYSFGNEGSPQYFQDKHSPKRKRETTIRKDTYSPPGKKIIL